MTDMKTYLRRSFYILLMGGLCVLSSATFAEKFYLLTEELPPYAISHGNKSTGVSVEITALLFERAGLDYEIKIMPWKRAYATTLQAKNTCLFPVQRNQEREASFRWISPLLITQVGFYSLRNSSIQIRTLEDAKAYQIGTYSGSASTEYLLSLGFKIESAEKDEQNPLKLTHRRIDMWSTDTLSAFYLSKQRNIHLAEQLVYLTTLRALACNVNTPEEALMKLDAALKSMYSDGSIDAITKHYLE